MEFGYFTLSDNHYENNTRTAAHSAAELWRCRTSGPERALPHSIDIPPNDRQPTAGRVAHTSSRKSGRSVPDHLVSSVVPFLSVGRLRAIEFEHEKPNGR